MTSAGFCVDDGLDKIWKVLPPRTACIDAGGDTVWQAVLIGIQPNMETAVGVQVNVEQAGCYVESRGIDILARVDDVTPADQYIKLFGHLTRLQVRLTT